MTGVQTCALPISRVHVYPYGAITRGEQGEALADLAALAPDVPGFSDDGRGVQPEDMMRRAMALAKKLDKPIAAHCEDERLLTKGWSMNEHLSKPVDVDRLLDILRRQLKPGAANR